MRRGRPSEVVFVERVVLEDPRLSLAAKGLYAVVAAWEEGQSSPSDESMNVLLDELKGAGYAYTGEDGQAVIGCGSAEEDTPQEEPARILPAPRTELQTKGWAYAICDAAAEQVKLGCSQNITRRLKGIQISHPAELRVLWQGAGGAAMEAHLHERFARRRIRGEWFDFTGVDALKLISRAAQSFRGGDQ